jgi:hypothetical protein
MEDSLYASIKTDWYDRAACKDTDTEILFFPVVETEELLANIKEEYCDHCPVWAKCLNSALVNNDSGFRGGMSTETRKALKRKRHRVKCPACLSLQLVTIHHDDGAGPVPPYEICLACGASWKGEPHKDPPAEVDTPCA